MPWRIEAKKDVIRCDKPGGGANNLWARDFWMGKPTFTDFDILLTFVRFVSEFVLGIDNWIHRLLKQTRGTETSQYPEEWTSTETPLVVASERGPGQWLYVSNQNGLGKPAIVGDSPVWVLMRIVLE